MITKQEPTIRKLVTDYNKRCVELQDLIQQGHAVPNATPAVCIDPKKLFMIKVG